MIDTSLYKEKPRELCVESTTSCNCRCDFCYNQNSFAKNGRDDNGLSTAELKKIIDIVSDAGIERIRFTGGEPLLRKDIFELASYAKEKNLQTVLNTNGMLIDKQTGEKIKKLFDICLISFFSCNKKYVDSVTNVDGTYEKKVQALENVQGCKQIWCSTIIKDPNLSRDLFKMYDIMQKYNVYNWFLLRTNPIEQNVNPHNFEEMEKIIDSIIQLEEKTGFILNIGNPLPFCCYKPKELQKIVDDGVFYAEARSKMVLDPFGNFVVDYCIRDKIGNIFKDDLLTCWKKEELNNIRGEKYLPNECQKCKYKDQCLGGSRFASKIMYGKYGELDPLARPYKYKEILFDE